MSTGLLHQIAENGLKYVEQSSVNYHFPDRCTFKLDTFFNVLLA